MNKMAVDVVLFPPHEIKDKVVKLNRKNLIPHISLLMGVVDVNDLVEIEDIFDNLSEKFSPLELKITNIHKHDSKPFFSEFVIEKTKEIENLQKEVVSKLKGYFTYDASRDMFYGSNINSKTVKWVNNYIENSAFEDFKPHITIGTVEVGDLQKEINFTTSKLALCHLGNYCTCRKILIKKKLKG